MAGAEGRRVSADELVLNKVQSPEHPHDHSQTSLSGRALSMQESGLILSPPARPEPLASRASKRLSLSLPVQAGEKDAAWLLGRAPTDFEPSTRQASPSLEVDQNSSIRMSNDFLVALAAQERKVLELKEELYRADSQLKKLKRQWTLYESSRKWGRLGCENTKIEVLQVEPMISGINIASVSNADNKSSRRSLNMDIDRRKAILAGSGKDSRRKIMSGGHTRALSLLSPVPGHYGETTQLSQTPISPRATEGNETGSYSASQSSTISNTLTSSTNKSRHTYQGSATIGVKQIAEDIKSGLWTFMEDLRQATVGEEAIKGVVLANPKLTGKGLGRKGGKSGQRASDQSPIRSPLLRSLASVAPETEDRKPSRTTDSVAQSVETISDTSNSAAEIIEPYNSVDDDWSNWDSPGSRAESGRWSNGTIISSPHTSNKSSPPNRLKELDLVAARNPNSKHDEASWPGLNDFIPSNIKRTASAIIREWEKSLTPPLTDEHEDLLSNIPDSMRRDTEANSKLLLTNLP